jgi:hypothetical protein
MLNRHFSPFKILFHEKSETLFILNPKVMTSFTKRIVLDALQEFGDECEIKVNRIQWIGSSKNLPLQPLSFYTRLAFGYSKPRVFALVRNPYTRTFSAWKDKFYDPHMRGGGAKSAYPRSIRRFELDDFRRFARKSRLEGGEENSLIPFSTLLARIRAQKVGRRNHHWDNQEVVLQAQHFRFNRIFKMETERDECFKVVFGAMGFDLNWIKSKMDRPVNQSSVEGVRLISGKDIEIMKEIYRSDFEFLGYDQSIPSSLKKFMKD